MDNAHCADCGVDVDELRETAYMVRDDVWRAAGLRRRDFACIGCLEKRLLRPLRPDDFPDLPINWWTHAQSMRLVDRIRLHSTLPQRPYVPRAAGGADIRDGLHVYAIAIDEDGNVPMCPCVDCDGRGVVPCKAAGCEIPEHVCEACDGRGGEPAVEILEAVFDAEGVRLGYRHVIAIATPGDFTKRLAFGDAEQAFRALAVLRDLPPELVAKIWR